MMIVTVRRTCLVQPPATHKILQRTSNIFPASCMVLHSSLISVARKCEGPSFVDKHARTLARNNSLFDGVKTCAARLNKPGIESGC
jgi:hypothetical protein